MLENGVKGKLTLTVTEEMTAKVMGSGELSVFATPCMIALIEKTAGTSVAPYLAEGEGTVGTLLNVQHTAPTPVGMQVTCETELEEVDRRRLVFRVNVYDEAGTIGSGTHERFVIGNEKFLAKAQSKKA